MTISQATLKNAAFAIEHDLFTDPDGANYLVKDGAILRRWEPGTSSADAFELAVTLALRVEAYTGVVMSVRYGTIANVTDVYSTHNEDVMLSESHDGDPLKATRLAIVRAAAIIGAKLCQS